VFLKDAAAHNQTLPLLRLTLNIDVTVCRQNVVKKPHAPLDFVHPQPKLAPFSLSTFVNYIFSNNPINRRTRLFLLPASIREARM
jgi:hypothetical protein